MTPARDRLRAVRRAYGGRGDRPGRADIAYNVYLGALMAVMVAFPVGRAVALALAAPAAVAALTAPGSVDVVGVVLGLALATLTLAGTLHGPVSLEPAFVRLLAETDLPRRRGLVRPFATKAAAVVTAALLGAGAFGGVLVSAGVVSLGGAARFVGLCAALGVVGAVAWLVGQAASPRVAGCIGAVIAALTVLGHLVPAVRVVLPWTWAAAAWPGVAPPFVLTDVLLVGLAAASVAAVPHLLDLLRGSRLAEDAARWHSVRTSALSGDVAHALGTLRARPAVGRRWRAVRGGRPALVFLVRDLVGAARTPVRLTVGFVVLLGSAVLVALAASVPSGWVLGGVGAGLAYLALGVLSDGFRHATDAAVAPPLYGYGTRTLFALHGIAPVVGAVAASAIGIGTAVGLGIDVRPEPVVAALLLGVLVRAYDSAKGPLPVVLLTSVPSPFGDLSSLVVSVWEADALVVATVTGALTVGESGASPVRALVVVAAVGCLLVVGLVRRLRRL